MKMTKLGLLLLLSATPAFAASTEGVPYYYQNRAGPNTYVGNARTQNVVASNSYSYTVPRTNVPVAGGGYIDGNGAIVGATTPNGVTGMTNPAWILSAEYTRKYGNFQFKTGVNSVLEWDDMILNEIGARLEHNFSMRDIDLFAHAEYRIGTMSDGGFSMDYDLLPFDENRPNEGIFTISMGEQSGKTNYMRFGFG
ncbi:MAG: hypothetical protein LBR41_00070, partial [Rickettsiales bacterium]|nr:hypothetical protein [Rickettsiales bacterium]